MPASFDTEQPTRARNQVLLKNVSAAVLVLAVVSGIVVLGWRWLEKQEALLQYLILLLTLIGFVTGLIRLTLQPNWRILWRFMIDYRTIVGLMVLAGLLWTWYLWNPTSDSTPGSGAETPASSSTPAESSGDTTTVSTPADIASGPFKIEGICAATADFDSELAATTYLEQRAWESATAHYGTDDNVRMATIPQFFNGRNLAEICIAVTFQLEASSQ